PARHHQTAEPPPGPPPDPVPRGRQRLRHHLGSAALAAAPRSARQKVGPVTAAGPCALTRGRRPRRRTHPGRNSMPRSYRFARTAKPSPRRRAFRPVLEALEDRLAPSRFAVISDYGQAGASEQHVADLVHGFNPDFVQTLGDNNYPHGEASTIDINIGQYYHDFIYPYFGSYGSGSTTDTNRFFPA